MVGTQSILGHNRSIASRVGHGCRCTLDAMDVPGNWGEVSEVQKIVDGRNEERESLSEKGDIKVVRRRQSGSLNQFVLYH